MHGNLFGQTNKWIWLAGLFLLPKQGTLLLNIFTEATVNKIRFLDFRRLMGVILLLLLLLPLGHRSHPWLFMATPPSRQISCVGLGRLTSHYPASKASQVQATWFWRKGTILTKMKNYKIVMTKTNKKKMNDSLKMGKGGDFMNQQKGAKFWESITTFSLYTPVS